MLKNFLTAEHAEIAEMNKEELDSITEKVIYLRLSALRAGLLINFNSKMLKNGLRRVVNEFPDSAGSAISAVN